MTIPNVLTRRPSQKQKDSKIAPRKPPTHDEMDTLKVKKAWEVALAPVKALPMTFIMMYMSGNSLQIFSIMMVFMAFKNPVMGLANTNQAFERFQTDTNSGKIFQTKFVYVVMQLVALAVGIWKINGMGLLPYVLFPMNAQFTTDANLAQNNTLGLVDVGVSKGGRGTRHSGFIKYAFRIIMMSTKCAYVCQ